MLFMSVSKKMLKYLLLFTLSTILLSGCIIIVEKPPLYHPEYTINHLGYAVSEVDQYKIMSCFEYPVYVTSGGQSARWYSQNVIDFFSFILSPHNPPKFSVYNWTKSYDRKFNNATITGTFFMEGARYDESNQPVIITYKGVITFHLRRTGGDNWIINGLDLTRVYIEDPHQTTSAKSIEL